MNTLKYKKCFQYGGNEECILWSDAIDFGKSCNDSNKLNNSKFPKDLKLDKWKKADIQIDTNDILTYKNSELNRPITERLLTFNIIKKTFSKNKNKPVLIMMAGISFSSFCNSAEIIVENIQKLKKKYKKVYIINLNPFKGYQIDVCTNYRDIMKLKLNKDSINRNELTKKEFKLIYESENKLNIQMAVIINDIISNKLKLTNVHLLGKCAGGGIVLELVSLNNIYTGVFLAVPASINHIKPLRKVSKERLENISFIFGWNKNDNYKFNFVSESILEKSTYDKEIGKLELSMNIQVNYQSYVFSPGNKHEINPELIDKISI